MHENDRLAADAASALQTRSGEIKVDTRVIGTKYVFTYKQLYGPEDRRYLRMVTLESRPESDGTCSWHVGREDVMPLPGELLSRKGIRTNPLVAAGERTTRLRRDTTGARIALEESVLCYAGFSSVL